jgi:S-DNA-T family DNA segregation ATPase FtsK/SpoIIIE
VIRPDEPLILPARPVDPAPPGFPLIASVAPLAVAALIWVITGSAFVLLFAILGPVIAVGSMIDGRRTARRARLLAEEAHLDALAALRRSVERQRDKLAGAAWLRTPSATSILGDPVGSVRWSSNSDADAPVLASLGSGEVPSGLRLEGGSGREDEPAIRELAATLTNAPITADPRWGIGIVASTALGRAMIRGLLLQLAVALPPGPVGLDAPPQRPWAWAVALPHAAARSPGRRIAVSDAGYAPAAGAGSRLLIALAHSLEELPTDCDTIVRLHGPTQAEIVRSTIHPAGLRFRPELVTLDQAAGLAGTLRERARTAGLADLAEPYRPIPAAVALADVADLEDPGPAGLAVPGPAGLRCAIGVGHRGAVTVDLIAAGPHAVVGGTTGSGKSELLVTWVAAMAAAHPHDAVTFLLIDFKGGAAFRPLLVLPHCVGLITDLDGREAARALASLAAELRYREKVIRAAGVRGIDELRALDTRSGPLPRLVIVVDEFATMLTTFPELHALFVDIAARGRSLGVHLILCTQRPNGVVRDALLANCSLRISLRVNNTEDSHAVLGTAAAAALSAGTPGRCLIAAGDGDPVLTQVATVTERDLRAISESRPIAPAPRRPWLDPLPASVCPADLTAAEEAGQAGETPPGIRIGLLDEPEHQRYRVARYQPALDGHLLVTGAGRTGKSCALAVVAEGHGPDRTVAPDPDVESVWDALEAARAALNTEPPGSLGVGTRGARLLLLDDFDSVYARWGDEHRAAAFELLTGLLRDGPAGGLSIVVAVQHLAGPLRGLPALFPCRLVLRLPVDTVPATAGTEVGRFETVLPPGGGSWNGTRIQLLQPTVAAASTPVAGPTGTGTRGDDEALRGPLLVVAGSPRRTMTAIVALHGGEVVDLASSASPEFGRLQVLADDGAILVGDADTWQTHWSLLGMLRPRAAIVFDGCGLADFRAISRRRDLPPPLAPGRNRVWVLRPDGAVVRSTIPEPGMPPAPHSLPVSDANAAVQH